MKKLKWISLTMLVLGLCSVPVQAQQLCGISASINDFFLVGNASAINVHVGDQIYYIVSIEVPLANFPIINGEPTLTLPDGAVIDLDDGLALSNGDFEIYDSRNYVGGIYTVDAADRNGNDEIQAQAAVTATCVEEPPDTATGTGEATAVIVTAPCTDVNIVSVPPGPVVPDTPIDLVVTEFNCGEDPLTAVSVVVNDGSSDIATLPASTAIESITDDDILEVGETMTWDATTDASLDNIVINVTTTFTATGTGTDPLDNIVTFPDDPNEQDSVTVVVIPPEPCIEVTKEVNCGVSKVGDEVIYTICIINCGDTVVFPTVISDDVLGDLLPTFEAAPPVGCFFETPLFLFPVESCCLDFPYTIQPGDDTGEVGATLVNTVIFEAIDEFDQVVEAEPAQATVELVHPCLEVDVECISEGPVEPGGFADFRITLNNCGDVDLLVDVNDSLGDCDGNDVLVLAGGFESCQTSIPIPADFADTEFCDEVSAHWTILEGGECLPNEGTVTDANCCEIGGQEGCTPGFWKNNAKNWGASAWCDAYEPGDDFSDVFGIPEQVLRANGRKTYPNPTLLQALDANGGGINALARHAVAALLNACSDCVNYPTDDPQDIIDAVQDAVAAGPEAIQDLHELLAYYNEFGCPVNQHGECVGAADEI